MTLVLDTELHASAEAASTVRYSSHERRCGKGVRNPRFVILTITGTVIDPAAITDRPGGTRPVAPAYYILDTADMDREVAVFRGPPGRARVSC